MNITLYKNNSEYNKLTKEIVNPLEVSGYLKNDSVITYTNINTQRTNPNSITTPILFIESENPSMYNYLYIEEFNRYYFINDIRCIRTNLWEITCSVDVLMSYKNKILELDVIVDKQEYRPQANTFYDDGSYINENKTFIETIDFENGFNDKPNYILIVSGGDVYYDSGV